MSRKHYIRIAQILKKGDKELSQHQIANLLANYFENDNPSFDKSRFLKACGYK